MNLKSNKIKYALGVIGALLIGAVGSGIWEVILEPCFSFIAKSVINFLFTLFSSLENSMYKSIARDYNEETSYLAVSLILFIYWAFMGILTYEFVLKHRINKKGFFANIEKELDNLEKSEQSGEKLDEIKSKLTSYRIRLRKIGYILFSLVVLVFAFIYSQSIILRFKTDKISEYKQYATIIKPYISEKDYDHYNSLFAQITTRKDYDLIMDSLRAIGKKNNISLNR